jgi:hypothetical protein
LSIARDVPFVPPHSPLEESLIGALNAPPVVPVALVRMLRSWGAEHCVQTTAARPEAFTATLGLG